MTMEIPCRRFNEMFPANVMIQGVENSEGVLMTSYCFLQELRVKGKRCSALDRERKQR